MGRCVRREPWSSKAPHMAGFALLWLLAVCFSAVVHATASVAAGAALATFSTSASPQSANSSLSGSDVTIAPPGRHPQTSLIPVLTASLARVQAATVAVDGTAGPSSHATSKEEAKAYASPAVAIPPALSFAGLGSHNFAPLTDKDIALINIILKSRSPAAAKGYVYDTGLPPVEELLNLHTAAATATARSQTNATAAAATSAERLSKDRMQALAQSSEPLGWLIRTFAVFGEALTKMRMTTELQLVIRDAISASIAAAAQVPANQVLTFATSNVTLNLGIDGLVWPTLPQEAATADNHAGLAAIREALVQLSGGFDRRHISVTFKQPAEAKQPAESETSNGDIAMGGANEPAQQGRSLRQAAADVAAQDIQQQQQQQQQWQGQHVEVCATFYGMAPSNVTSLLEALSMCTPPGTGEPGAAGQAAAAAAGSGSTVQDLVVGQPLTSSCSATFEKLLRAAQVQPAQDSRLQIAAVDQPAAGITLSVAVGLTSQQTLQDVDEQTSQWLNSSALQDILEDFNLSTESHEFLSLLVTPVGGQQLEGLAGLLPLLLPPAPTAAAAPPSGTQPQQTNPALTKGILAGIIVAAVTSVLALLSVGLLLLLRRRQDRVQQQDDQLPTAAVTGSRRRRRRPRLYQSKYLPHSSSAVPGPAPPGNQEPQELPKPHLERGDSVSSAVHFEAEDAADGTAVEDEESGASSNSSSHHGMGQGQGAMVAVAGPTAAAAANDSLQQRQLGQPGLWRAGSPAHSAFQGSLPRGMSDFQGSLPRGMSDFQGSLPRGMSDFQGSLPRGMSDFQGSLPRGMSDFQGSLPRGMSDCSQWASSSSRSASSASIAAPAAVAAAAAVLSARPLVQGQPQAAAATEAMTVGAGQGSDCSGQQLQQQVEQQLCHVQPARGSIPGQGSPAAAVELQEHPSAIAEAAELAQGAVPDKASSCSSSSNSSSNSRDGVGEGGTAAVPSPSRVACLQEHSSPALDPPSATTSSAAGGATARAPAGGLAGSVFAAMDVQLTAAAHTAVSHGSSGAGSRCAHDEVQPLGLSCWHAYGHESGFRLGSQEQQQQEQQQHRKPNNGALVSPFAMAFSCASDASA